MLMVAIGLNVLANAPISLFAIRFGGRLPAVIDSECYSDRVNAEFRTALILCSHSNFDYEQEQEQQ
jgi:hypothetical protein